MLNNDPSVDSDEGFMPSLMAAAELQDHLMTVSNDLERLQRLLDDAGAALSEHFFAASSLLEQQAREAAESGRDASVVQKLQSHVAAAITALQFQDMSTQLIARTSQRLRNCSDQLARDTFGDDEDGMAVVEIAPLRPNPVTQDEMDAGSIELF